MHAQTYDFALGANQSVAIEAVGEYVKLISSTGTVRIELDTGPRMDAMAGQGIRKEAFNRILITDKSNAANVGKVLVGFAEMIDDRITGEVSVIDGGKARTKAGQAFLGSSGITPAAGFNSHAQIDNASVGTNLVVEQICITSSTTQMVTMQTGVAQLGVDYGAFPSKLVGGPGSQAHRRASNNSAVLGVSASNYQITANQALIIKFAEPVVIGPGQRMTFAANTANTDLFVNFEFFEEPV